MKIAIKKEISNLFCLLATLISSNLLFFQLSWNKKYAERKIIPEIKMCIKKDKNPEGLNIFKL